MSKRVSFKMYGEDAQYALDFANAVGQPLDKIAKIALVQYINNTIEKAANMMAQLEKEREKTP